MLLLVSALTGCSAVVTQDQPVVNGEAVVEAGRSIGQTFVARHDGLSGIQVYLLPGNSDDGVISLHLRTDPTAADNIASSIMPVSTVTTPGYYWFDFTVQPRSTSQYYYAVLQIEGRGDLLVGINAGNTYLDGSLHQNDMPLDAQMAFNLIYQPAQAIIGLFKLSILSVGLLGVTTLVYILPGWAMLSALWSGWNRLDWAEKACLASGMTLAIYPLLLLWTDVLGLHLGAVYTWLPVSLAILYLMWRNRKSLPALLPAQLTKTIRQKIGKVKLIDILLIILLLIIFGVRMWVIHPVDVPMWGDSLHHSIITQLIVIMADCLTHGNPMQTCAA